MDLKVKLTTFGRLFLAELGDQTQLATFCFAAESPAMVVVFFGSAGALVLNTALACVLGSAVSRVVPANCLNLGAGALFVLLGLWMIFFPTAK